MSALRLAAVPIALALPVFALAAPPRSAWGSSGLLLSVLTGVGALLFSLAYAAERARRGTRGEHLAHAVAWLLLIPGAFALSIAVAFAPASERTVGAERALALTPGAVLYADALRPRPAPWAHLPAWQRASLAKHGAFERALKVAGSDAAETGGWRALRSLIPALFSSVFLILLSSLGRLGSRASSRESIP